MRSKPTFNCPLGQWVLLFQTCIYLLEKHPLLFSTQKSATSLLDSHSSSTAKSMTSNPTNRCPLRHLVLLFQTCIYLLETSSSLSTQKSARSLPDPYKMISLAPQPSQWRQNQKTDLPSGTGFSNSRPVFTSLKNTLYTKNSKKCYISAWPLLDSQSSSTAKSMTSKPKNRSPLWHWVLQFQTCIYLLEKHPLH
jgi:hypothetical protein